MECRRGRGRGGLGTYINDCSSFVRALGVKKKSNIMIKGIWGSYRSSADLIAAARKCEILGDNRNVLQGTQICLRSSQTFIMRLQYRVDLIVCAAWGTLWQSTVVTTSRTMQWLWGYTLRFISETFWKECMSPVIPELETSVSSA
jgi:hypothetical protein